MNMKTKVKFFLWAIPSIALAVIFLSNGFEALTHSGEFLEVAGVAHFLGNNVDSILTLVGIVDILVGLLLIFYYGKYKYLIIIYAMLWPFVPNILRQIGGIGGEWPEVAMYVILAIVSYIGFNQQKRLRS